MRTQLMILDQSFLWHAAAIAIVFTTICWLKHATWIPLEEGQQSILGIATGFVATLFAFILGFTIANLWTDYKDAEKLVLNEATELRTLYRISKSLDRSEAVRDHIKQYVEGVIDDEWKAMTSGNKSVKADQAKNRLWDETLALIKCHPQETVLTKAMIDALVQFNHHRRERVNLLIKSVHPLIYYTLILSGMSTIFCFSFLSVKKTKLQYVLDAMIVTGIVFNIYLVSAIDHPFSGTGVTVSPVPFEYLQQQLAEDAPSASAAPTDRR